MTDLSIIVPAYNEQNRITPFLTDLAEHCAQSSKKYEILIVDDGSTDATVEVLASFLKAYPFLRLIRHPMNRGKGAAVRTGMLQACGRHRVFMDADGSFSPAEIEPAASWLDRGYDVVIGSRFARDSDKPIEETVLHRILRAGLNGLTRSVLGLRVLDSQCGFKLFSETAARTIFSKNRVDHFAFDLEILYLAAKSGFRIKETRVSCVAKPGSKVRIVQDSFRLFLSIFSIRLRSVRSHPSERPSDVPVV